MSKCLEDGEPISSLSLDSCEPALLADVISLMFTSHRSIMMLVCVVLLKQLSIYIQGGALTSIGVIPYPAPLTPSLYIVHIKWDHNCGNVYVSPCNNTCFLSYLLRTLSLEDMVRLLLCVKQLLLPNKTDRFVCNVF